MIIQSDIERLPIADNSIDLIFTDPPYPREYLSCYWWLAQEAKRVLKPGGFVLAMCGGIELDTIFKFFAYADLTYFWMYEIEFGGQGSGIVWHRGNDNIRKTIVVRSKPVLAFGKGKSGPRTSTMGMFPAGGADKKYHAWGQDVASARYYIDCFSAPGDTILDPFIGGGTTAVACELIGRRWIGGDVDPVACRTSLDRIAGAEIPYALPMFAHV